MANVLCIIGVRKKEIYGYVFCVKISPVIVAPSNIGSSKIGSDGKISSLVFFMKRNYRILKDE